MSELRGGTADASHFTCEGGKTHVHTPPLNLVDFGSDKRRNRIVSFNRNTNGGGTDVLMDN